MPLLPSTFLGLGLLLPLLAFLLLLGQASSEPEPVVGRSCGASSSSSGGLSSSCGGEGEEDDSALLQHRTTPSRPLQPAPGALEPPPSKRVGEFVAHGPAAEDAEYVRVPHGGWHHKSCIIEVPTGTLRSPHPEKDGYHLLTFPDGTQKDLEPCRFPSSGLRHLDRASSRKDMSMMSMDQGPWVGKAAEEGGSCLLPDGWASSGPLAMFGSAVQSPMKSFTASTYVPTSPLDSTRDTWLYWWIGAMPADYNHVLQPVLMYNQDSGWAAASWDCCPGGNQVRSESLTGLQANEEIRMSINETSPSSYDVSACTSSGRCSTLSNARDLQIQIPLVQLETYNVADPASCGYGTCSRINCNYMPTSALAMNDLQVSPSTTWGPTSSRCWSVQQCGWDVAAYSEGFSEPALWATPPR